jgi:predicted nuclease with TOPRIM domain
MVTIDQDLKDVLGQITASLDKLNSKIDGVAKDVIDVKISVARLEEGQKSLSDKFVSLDKRLEKVESQLPTLAADISDLKGAKSLIIPIVVAVLTSLTTLLIRAIPNP